MTSPATLALLAALTNPFSSFHLPHRGDVQQNRERIEGWRLEVAQDRFDGRTRCELRRGAVSVRHGVASFTFGRATPTAAAEFRIDAGPPQKAADVAEEAAGLGAAIAGDDLRNPSGGRVAIPLRLLTQARQVSIRPHPRSAHRDFDLGGLDTALARGQVQGCDLSVAAPPPVRP